MQQETILFILTGGTIDSYYNGLKDTVEPLEHSIMPNYLRSLKLYENLEFVEVCMKDSRALTMNDLTKILEIISETPHKKIIITHGTYTMPDTARFLKANLQRRDQTIILTGAMIPLVGFSPSDSPFNLWYSIAKIQDINEFWIHVCMNGRLFDPEEVVKFLQEWRFISIFADS